MPLHTPSTYHTSASSDLNRQSHSKVICQSRRDRT